MTHCLPAHPAASYRPRHTRRITCQAAGFSLVELSIVVLIVSILLTMGLAAFNAQLDTASLSATQRKQETIKDALITYLRTSRRLPCPETTGLPGGNAPTGRENRTNGAPPDPNFPCTSYVGTLPWRDLGLPKDVALDGYGNFFTYFVSSAAADNDPDWARTANPGTVTGFSVGSPGRFAITHNGQATGIDASSNPLPALAAVVLVSHGRTGLGAITEKGSRNLASADMDELANSPPLAAAAPSSWSPQVSPYQALGMVAPGVVATLVTGTTTAGNTFDDVVLVLRPNDLLAPIIKDGAMKSVQAQLSEQFGRIKTALASYAFRTPNGTYVTGACTTPGTPPYCRLLPPSLASAGLITADITDPWGSAIRYTPNIPIASAPNVGLSNSTPGDAYSLASNGADKVQGTPDDFNVTVSAVELRQMIGTSNLP